jgi:hypothetical protein
MKEYANLSLNEIRMQDFYSLRKFGGLNFKLAGNIVENIAKDLQIPKPKPVSAPVQSANPLIFMGVGSGFAEPKPLSFSNIERRNLPAYDATFVDQSKMISNKIISTITKPIVIPRN